MNIPLYQVIVDDIKEKIEAGLYTSGHKLPSEKELSDTYKVSRITSKRALNDLEEMQLIKRVQGKGSFVIKTHSKELKGESFLYIMPFPDSSDFGNYASGILKVLDNYEINLQIRDSLNLTPHFLNSIKDQYAGVIYYPKTNEEALEITSRFLFDEIPCVLIDKEYAGIPFSSITSDNFGGTFQATKHLIDQGFKNIKFITSTRIDHHSSVMERFLGYVDAKRQSNIPYSFHEDIIVMEDESQLQELIEGLVKDGCEGIVCENDILAIRIINRTNAMGYDIIPTVGFDNIHAAQMISPTLSTIEQDFETIGSVAAQHLIESILNEDTPKKISKIKTKLLIRESSQGEKK